MDPVPFEDYLFVHGDAYRANPKGMLLAGGFSVVDWMTAFAQLRWVASDRDAAARLRKAFGIPNNEDEEALLRELEWLLGPSPRKGWLEQPGMFARLLVLRRDPPPRPKPLEIVLFNGWEPAPLDATDSWVVIECVDDSEAQRPVSSFRLEITTAAGLSRTVYTDAKGVARVEGIAPGNVTIRPLDIDGYQWRPLEGEDSKPSNEDNRFTWHQVLKGECLSKIAHRYGFKYWQDVWRFRLNKDLREKRKSPHVLYPGDMVAVPAPRLYAMQRQTESTYRIEVRRRPVRRGYVLEDRPLRFHPKSTVLLPQAESGDDSAGPAGARGVEALAGTLRHAEQHPTRTLLLAGHSDQAESPDGDRTLSERRTPRDPRVEPWLQVSAGHDLGTLASGLFRASSSDEKPARQRSQGTRRAGDGDVP